MNEIRFNEKHLVKICAIITMIGILLLIPFSINFFEQKTITEMLSKEGEKGAIYGRIDYIINEGNPTIFILNDGNKSKVFSPNFTTLKQNIFVTVYGETKLYEGEKEIFAYYVVVE
jgi:hypothetical protein